MQQYNIYGKVLFNQQLIKVNYKIQNLGCINLTNYIDIQNNILKFVRLKNQIF